MLRRRRAVYRGGDVNVYTKKEKERGNITGSAPVAASAVVTPPATPAVVRDASAETSRSGGFGGVAKVATVAAAATLATAVVRSRGSRSGPLPVGAKATAKTPNVEAPIRPEGVKYNSQGKRISLIRPQNRALEALNNPPVTSKPTPAPAGAGTTARDAATNRREKGRSRA